MLQALNWVIRIWGHPAGNFRRTNHEKTAGLPTANSSELEVFRSTQRYEMGLGGAARPGDGLLGRWDDLEMVS